MIKGYGVPDDPHALHRLTNPQQQTRNYNAVCNRQIIGPPPHQGLSCDEYPFKTTYEGGTTLSKANRSWAWVPTSEQNSQGALYLIAHSLFRARDTRWYCED
jgi:hypothetical protein